MRKYFILLTFIMALVACSDEGEIPDADQKSKLFAFMQRDFLNYSSSLSATFSSVESSGLTFSDPFSAPTSSVASTFVINGLQYTVTDSNCRYFNTEGYFGMNGLIYLGDEIINIWFFMVGYPADGVVYSFDYSDSFYFGISYYHRVADEYISEAFYMANEGSATFISDSGGLRGVFSNVVLQEFYDYSTIQAEGELWCSDVVVIN